jgi:hypothetical protein
MTVRVGMWVWASIPASGHNIVSQPIIETTSMVLFLVVWMDHQARSLFVEILALNSVYHGDFATWREGAVSLRTLKTVKARGVDRGFWASSQLCVRVFSCRTTGKGHCSEWV